MKLTAITTRTIIISFCITILLIIIIYVYKNWLNTNTNNNNLKNKPYIIEPFNFNEDPTKVNENIAKLGDLYAIANKYLVIEDSINTLLSYDKSSLDNQMNGLSVTAQENAEKVECKYLQIRKYFFDNGLNLDDVEGKKKDNTNIPSLESLNNSINKVTDNLKAIIDAQLKEAQKFNDNAQQLVNTSRIELETSVKILNAAPPSDTGKLNEMIAKVNTKDVTLKTMDNSNSTAKYESGLFFVVSSQYHNGQPAFFNNSPPMGTTQVAGSQTSSSGTGIMSIGAPDGYDFPTDPGMSRTNSRCYEGNVDRNDIKNCSICKSTTYQNSCIPDDDSWSNYSVEWIGYFKVSRSGVWNFSMTSDDLSLLWIGNEAIGDNANPSNNNFNTGNCLINNRNNSGHCPASAVASKNLSAGIYPFRAQFTENGGQDTMLIKFQPPGQSWQVDGNGIYFADANNPQSNMNTNPTNLMPGLYFHIVDGGQGANVNYIGLTPRKTQLISGNASTTISNGGSTGFSTDLTDMCSATKVSGNGANSCITTNSRDTYSIQWTGYLYTQSYNGTWVFTLDTNCWTFFWLNSDGDGQNADRSAEGTGNAGNFSAANAKLSSTAVSNIPQKSAFVLGQTGMGPWGMTGGNPNAQWIWSDPGGASNADNDPWTFYGSFNSNGSYTGTIEASLDNIGSIILNGQMLNGNNSWGGGWNSGAGIPKMKVNISNGINNIIVICQNQGGPAGFLLNVSDESGHYVYTTDSSWTFSKGSNSTAPNPPGTQQNSCAVTLTSNIYYPIRIVSGSAGTPPRFKISFTPPGGSATSNGSGFFFHNSNNPKENTESSDPNSYAKEEKELSDTLAIVAQLQKENASRNAERNAAQSTYNNAKNIHDKAVDAAGTAYEHLIEVTHYTDSLTKIVDGDRTKFNNDIYGFFRPKFYDYKYTDRYGNEHYSLEGVLAHARDIPYNVIKAEKPSTKNGLCWSDKIDERGHPLTTFKENEYCYYARTDARSVTIKKPGETLGNYVMIDVESADFIPNTDCTYDPIKYDSNNNPFKGIPQETNPIGDKTLTSEERAEAAERKRRELNSETYTVVPYPAPAPVAVMDTYQPLQHISLAHGTNYTLPPASIRDPPPPPPAPIRQPPPTPPPPAPPAEPEYSPPCTKYGAPFSAGWNKCLQYISNGGGNYLQNALQQGGFNTGNVSLGIGGVKFYDANGRQTDADGHYI